MKNKNSVSVHSLLLSANDNYKKNSFSVNSLQNFCTGALSGKFAKVSDNCSAEKVQAANDIRGIAKETGMKTENFQFSVFLENYEKITGYKSVDKKGNNKLFSLFSYVKVCRKVYELSKTKPVIISENKETKLTRSQTAKIANLSKQLKNGKIDKDTFDLKVSEIKKAA